MHYLVTGRAGTGKSAIARELVARGLVAVDADAVPGLCKWQDLGTKQFIDVDWRGYVDYSKVGWNWLPEVLESLLADNPEVVVCGSSSNELAFFDSFDAVFVLTIEPETQKQRILDRTGNDYGKHPETLQEILAHQAVFVDQALALGAVPIDANPSLNQVIDTIMEHCDGR